ncbi:MAG: hypothetical protein RL358_187 [Pseudomonadota bacterium]
MDGRAASQTITDKIPHLLTLGVTPIIVSGALGQQDAVLEHHQVLSALPVGLRFDLRHYLRNRIANRSLYRLITVLSFFLLLPIYVLEKLILPIETTWSWSISAFLVSRRIIKRSPPTLIYSTGGAYAAHLAGYWLAKCYGIPWIAEIHDPMLFEGQPVTRRRRKFIVWLERKICTHADLVWWFTDEAMERAKARNPKLAQRGHWVLAGVDAPQFERIAYRKKEHLVIAHFGSLSETRNLQEFLSALENFIRRDEQRANQVRVHIYGGSVDAISAQAMHEFSHPKVIQNFGRIETDSVTGESGRTQVLKRMNSADCLLLLHGTVPFCEEYIPSKFYEYLWTQRPILGLVHHNPQLTKLLHDNHHWAIDAQNVESISASLEEIYIKWAKDELADNGVSSQYTTRNAVQNIYQWATEVLTAKQH